MADVALKRVVELAPRKPPAAAQWNWITGGLDVRPEQLELPMPPAAEVVLPEDDSMTLLATENGSQLFVSGFGLFVGKKSERVVVKKGKAVCAQAPFVRLQEIVIARGASRSPRTCWRNCASGESGWHV